MSEPTHEELSTLIEEHRRDLQHFSCVACKDAGDQNHDPALQ